MENIIFICLVVAYTALFILVISLGRRVTFYQEKCEMHFDFLFGVDGLYSFMEHTHTLEQNHKYCNAPQGYCEKCKLFEFYETKFKSSHK